MVVSEVVVPLLWCQSRDVLADLCSTVMSGPAPLAPRSRQRPASAGPRPRAAVPPLRRSGSASSALSQGDELSIDGSSAALVGLWHASARRPATTAHASTSAAAKGTTPRSRPPLLGMGRPSSRPTDRDQSKDGLDSDAAAISHGFWEPLATPPPLGRVLKATSKSGIMTPTRGRPLSAGALSSRSSSTGPAIPGRRSPSYDAEAELLRARFDLRLDAERVRTQQDSAELRGACDNALRLQQAVAVSELEAVRRSYEEVASLQRSSAAVELAKVRAEAEQARNELLEEAAASRLAEGKREANLKHILEAAEHEAATAVACCKQAEAEVQAERVGREKDAAELRAKFFEHREEQVAEVIARFEGEHFRLAARLAEEGERRLVAEEEFAEARVRLEELRHRTVEAEALLPEAVPTCRVSVVSCGVQTSEPVSELLLPPSYERLEMQVADAAAQMWRSGAAEAERLALVEERMRCAIALKNDVIDGLKDELWRRECEILEARGILAGVELPVDLRSAPMQKVLTERQLIYRR
eukprot:gnl/TRDRNA2_/TRDRNA2_134352_c0_seq1.p1 gnl/TRDRNA2_/TRDRNA2_134352_c0~~gnl/TRDRNA2_/TRDRNA2_134352_c0_seq1.p1  ORF type:complete len:542 (+),score=114.10 gnl/TRDRNA2_/TRDRNA2_134352_c0_seq1:42-1628(+)